MTACYHHHVCIGISGHLGSISGSKPSKTGGDNNSDDEKDQDEEMGSPRSNDSSATGVVVDAVTPTAPFQARRNVLLCSIAQGSDAASSQGFPRRAKGQPQTHKPLAQMSPPARPALQRGTSQMSLDSSDRSFVQTAGLDDMAKARNVETQTQLIKNGRTAFRVAHSYGHVRSHARGRATCITLSTLVTATFTRTVKSAMVCRL